MHGHELGPKDDAGRQRCIHCGTLHWQSPEVSCIHRPSPEPVRPRRMSALDDIDTISERLAEFRREREAAMATPVSEPAASCLD